MLRTCRVQVKFYLPRLLPRARIRACLPDIELQREDDREGDPFASFVYNSFTKLLMLHSTRQSMSCWYLVIHKRQALGCVEGSCIIYVSQALYTEPRLTHFLEANRLTS